MPSVKLCLVQSNSSVKLSVLYKSLSIKRAFPKAGCDKTDCSVLDAPLMYCSMVWKS